MLTGCTCPRKQALARALYAHGQSLGALEDTWIPLAHELNSATTELDLKVDSLAKDMLGAPSSLQSQWDLFHREWKEWEDSFWFNSWRRRDELLVYRRRFNELLKAYQSGGGTSTVAPYTPEQASKETARDKPDKLDRLMSLAKTGLVIGGIVAGGYALGRVTGFIGEVRR